MVAAVAGASEDVASGSFSAKANGVASAVVLSGLMTLASSLSPGNVIPSIEAEERVILFYESLAACIHDGLLAVLHSGTETPANDKLQKSSHFLD